MDRGRATLGLLLAGGALVAAGAALSATSRAVALAIAAGVTAMAFSARRHGFLTRRAAALIGGVGGAAIAIGAGALVVLGAPGSPERIAIGVGALLGLGCVVVAVAEAREIPVSVVLEHGRVISLGVAVGFGGLVVAGLLGSLPGALVGGAGLDPPEPVAFGLAQAGTAVGFAIATAGFVHLTGRPWTFIDLRWPTRRELSYVVTGTVAILVSAIAVQLVLVQFGVEFVEHSVEERARGGDPTILGVAFVFSFVANGLGEELLYRNVVQKYFAERFAPAVAITFASIVFALVHFPAYGDPDTIATLGTVTVVFVLSLVLGVAYHRTENIVVPALIHGSYNGLMWLLVFVSL